jgi:serine/threonine-protein kinase
MILAGGYRVSSFLGDGGCGTVLAVSEIETGREFAAKVLNTAAAADPVNHKRFWREAKIAASIRHPNLCDVVGFGTLDARRPYLIMERLRGETLRARLYATGPFSVPDAVAVSAQLLDALSVVHGRGIIHRDVKATNVFITTPRDSTPSIKLFDFGIAKPLPSIKTDEFSAVTNSDVIPGTPYYLTPEQIAGAKDLDERVDVWAVGLLLYEMLTGRRAFVGKDYRAVAIKILTTEPPPASTYRSDVPAELDRILARAISKDRKKRHPSAAALRQDMLACWAKERFLAMARWQALRANHFATSPVATLKRAEEVPTLDEIPIEWELGSSTEQCRVVFEEMPSFY